MFNTLTYITGIIILGIFVLLTFDINKFWLLFFTFSILHTLCTWLFIQLGISFKFLFALNAILLVFLVWLVKYKNIKLQIGKNLVYGLLLSIVFGITRFMYINTFAPQGIHNLDFLVHLNAIIKFLLNNKFALNLVHVHPMFTVFAYVPVFHIVFGGALYTLLPKAIFSNLYLVETAVFWVFSLVVMLILYKLTKNWFVSFLVASISLFIFDLDGAYTVYFLIPQTLVSILGFYLFSLIFIYGPKVYKRLIFWIAVTLLIPMHLLIGTLWFSLIVFATIFFEISSKFAITLTFAFFSGLLAAAYFNFFNFLKIFTWLFPKFMLSRKGDYIVYSFTTLVNKIVLNYSLFIAIILLFGVIWLIFTNKYKHNVLGLSLLAIFVLLASNFLYVHKLFVIFHYIVLLVLAVIFNKILKNVPQFAAWLVFLMFFANGIISLNAQFSEYAKRESYYNGKYYLVLPYEYNLAQDLNILAFGKSLEHKKIYNQCIVLSNPVEMYFIDGLSLCDSLHGYVAKPFYRQILYLVLRNNNMEPLAKISELAEYKHIYLVVTPRTIEWLKKFSIENLNDFKFGIWTLTTDKWQTINCPVLNAKLVKKAQNYCIYQVR